MGDETNRPENDRGNNGGELRHDGIRHEHFSLRSSQTKPFDSERMAGKPTSSKDTTDSKSASGSDKK